MAGSKLKLALFATLALGCSNAWAIHVEQDHPGLQNPKARLADSGRDAESTINGGTTSISASSFTSFNAQGVKRKPFPPGYGRSGYEFEDEVLRPPAQPLSAAEGKTAAQAAPSPAAKP